LCLYYFITARKEDSSSSDEETPQDSPTPLIKVSKRLFSLLSIYMLFSISYATRAIQLQFVVLVCSQIKSGHGKGPAEFEKLRLLQDLSGEHVVCPQLISKLLVNI